MRVFNLAEELEKERKKNKELEEKINNAINYIKKEEKANPDSNRKDVGLILMNYKRMLNILKGSDNNDK